MKIDLRPDWVDKISGKEKVYKVGQRDQKVIDETFGSLESQNRLYCTTQLTLFSYLVFVVYKHIPGQEEPVGHVVVDILELNDMTIPDAYPMPS
jgi:hypothetical protein